MREKLCFGKEIKYHIKVDLGTAKATHAPNTHHCLNLAQFTLIMSIICDIKPDMAILHGHLIAIIASRNFQYRPTLI